MHAAMHICTASASESVLCLCVVLSVVLAIRIEIEGEVPNGRPMVITAEARATHHDGLKIRSTTGAAPHTECRRSFTSGSF